MTAVIDKTSAIEVINGARTYTELTSYGYEIADRIDVWLEQRPGYHSPSAVARGVKANTAEAESILSWMSARQLVMGAGNGRLRKYQSRAHR